MGSLGLTTLLVPDYDSAVEFFVVALGFDLVEDTPTVAGDGAPKRWVVVRPQGAESGLLLAQPTTDAQRAAVGHQAGDRVGFFLHVDDFTVAYEQMAAAGVEFLEPPRREPYGQVVVFRDLAGNCWDLLGPPERPA